MWTYGGIRITVTELKEESEQTVIKLQPVDAGTVYQTFGWINDSFPLQGYVVGSGELASLQVFARDGTTHSLVCNGVTLGNFYLNKLSSEWLTVYKQTIRPDKSSTDYVYRVGLDLSKE